MVMSTIDFSQMTPSQLDEHLNEWGPKAAHAEAAIERINERNPNNGTMPAWDARALAAAEQALASAEAQAAPVYAEWERRGGWTRGYLVVSSDGHVHTSTRCQSCNFRTQFTLLSDLSGMAAEQVIAAVGYKACTVCYPDAPLHPAWIKGEKDAQAAEKAKQDAQCELSGTYAKCAPSGQRPGPGEYDPRKYARRTVCPTCSNVVAVTSTGKIRTHKPGK